MSFPRYPEYKNSGAAWLGDVPEHWSIANIRRICEIKKRIAGQVGIDVFSITQRGFRIKDLEANEGQMAMDYSKYQLVEVGDFAMNHMDLITGGVDIAQSRGVTSPDYRVFSIRDHSLVHDRYLLRLFEICLRRRIFYAYGQGSAQLGRWRLPTDRFNEFVFPVPPKAEQQRISAFVDRETARIDALVAEQQRLIELLKEKRQAVISHAVTKGLNPDAPMRPSGIEWLGDVPAHWGVKRLKHISPYLTVGIVVNPSSYLADSGLPFIYGGDIREGVINWENSRRISSDDSTANSKTQLHAGDLLTVRVGAPGVTAVVPIECEGGNCASVMLIRRGNFNSNWLCHAMNTRVVRVQVEVVQYGAAQEQFNISHAVNFWIPTPPVAEQNEIAEFIESETAQFDSLISEAQLAITLLQERRTALISAAVTGQIDVRNLATTLAI